MEEPGRKYFLRAYYTASCCTWDVEAFLELGDHSTEPSDYRGTFIQGAAALIDSLIEADSTLWDGFDAIFLDVHTGANYAVCENPEVFYSKMRAEATLAASFYRDTALSSVECRTFHQCGYPSMPGSVLVERAGWVEDAVSCWRAATFSNGSQRIEQCVENCFATPSLKRAWDDMLQQGIELERQTLYLPPNAPLSGLDDVKELLHRDCCRFAGKGGGHFGGIS